MITTGILILVDAASGEYSLLAPQFENCKDGRKIILDILRHVLKDLEETDWTNKPSNADSNTSPTSDPVE